LKEITSALNPRRQIWNILPPALKMSEP